MNVEEIMSKELIVGYVPGTVEDALTILSKNDVSGIPVLKKNTNIIKGIVTRTDIFRNAEEDQLAMVMNENYSAVKPTDDIEKAAKLFYKQRIHGLPVVTKKNELVGILSPNEILKVLIRQKHDDPVERLATNRVVPVYKETPINIVMEIIKITNENALPVLDENRKVIGIVSDGDIFKLSQIKEDIEERYESIPSERIMTYNLQKLEDLGMIEKVGERYEYTGELGEGALEDIESMLDRVISVMFEEYGDAIGIENLREVIIEKTEEVIEKNS